MTRSTRALLAVTITGLTLGLSPVSAGALEPAAGSAPEATTPLTEPPPSAVLPSTTSTSYFDTPRDLTGCPHVSTPPAPVDLSEVPLPGQPSPVPPPVPETQPGGTLLSGCQAVVPEGFQVPREVTASAWMVTDLDTGEIIAAQDPHGRYRPASIIKTLLASVALDSLDPGSIVTVTDADLEGAEGSLVGVGPDGKYTVHRLLSGLLMSSGNDAAAVLAHQMGGIQATLEAMNAHATAIGATGTWVASVSGLDAPGMMTTAYDMSLIFADALSRPAFAEIISTQMTGFPGYPAGEGAGAPDPADPAPYTGPTTRPDGVLVNPGFVLANDNQLLYNYPGAIGGKTGFTDDARHTFIGAAERDGRRLSVVLLDGTRVPSPPWQQAAALLDSGFATRGSIGRLEAGGTGSVESDHEAGAAPGDPESAQLASGITTADVGDVAPAGRTPWMVAGVVALVTSVGAASVLVVRSRRQRRRG